MFVEKSVLLPFLCISLVFLVAEALKCKDENNNDVDWFFAYKLPRLEYENTLTRNSNIRSGGAYAYMTSEENTDWTLSDLSLITNSTTVIGNTLRPVYERDDDVFYVAYNDEPPNKDKNSEKGHTKGVVLGDSDGGVWLIHSVPEFPEVGSYYTYPESGTRYGQSFLCLSLDLVNINKVGLQLQYNEPEIYAEHMVRDLHDKIPDLVDASWGSTIKEEPWFHKTILSTVGGNDFVSYAKAGRFGKELYSDLVAKDLKTDLLTETWLNGVGRIPSNCYGQYWVKNIESISLLSIKFKNSQDHSKWAVSKTEGNYWTCVGDINREEHQKHRGGGTVCTNNKQIQRAYEKTVSDIEECSRAENEIFLNLS